MELGPDPERPWLRIDVDKIPANIDPGMVMDFRNFLYVAMKHLGMGEPTKLQYAMAYRLQHGPEAFQLQAGRGAGKSVLTSMFATWLLLSDPNTVIMVLSATGNKSTEFISMTRANIQLIPELKHLTPGPNTKDSAFGFNVEARTKVGQDASVFARGISGQITGSHADWVIMDDVEIEGTPTRRRPARSFSPRCGKSNRSVTSVVVSVFWVPRSRPSLSTRNYERHTTAISSQP